MKHLGWGWIGLVVAAGLPAGAEQPFLTAVASRTSWLQATPIAAGDFNRDGFPDLAVRRLDAATASYDAVGIYLGNGTGQLTESGFYPMAGYQDGLAAGDYNGDGFLDIAGPCQGGLCLLLGAPKAKFVPLTLPYYGSTVQTARINGDARDDLVLVDSSGGHTVLLAKKRQRGTNPFAGATQANFSGQSVASLAFGDLNHDGKTDGVAGTGSYPGPGGSLWVMWGDGTGRFSLVRTSNNLPATGVAIGDVNGDGHADIAYSDPSGLWARLGDGAGSLSEPSWLGLGGVALQGLADLTGDGVPDLLTSDTVSVGVHSGDGAGHFGPAQRNAAVNRGIVLADFNRDGLRDVAMCGYYGLLVLLGDAGGSLRASRLTPLYQPPPGLVSRRGTVADFDGDGYGDFVMAGTDGRSMGNLMLYKGSPDGTLTPWREHATPGSPYALASGDLDGDGDVDLVAACHSPSKLTVHFNDGTGVLLFDDRWIYPLAAQPMEVKLVDLNHDGALDAVVTTEGGGDGATVLLGDGHGALTPIAPGASDNFGGASLGLGDLDRDGETDAVVAAPGGRLKIMRGRGDGTFADASWVHVLPTARVQEVAIGDFDGDGNPDFAVASLDPTGVTVFLGDGAGHASTGPFLPTERDRPTVKAIENRFGHSDLLVSWNSFRPAQVFRLSPERTLSAVQDINLGSWYQRTTIGDVDGNGRPDAVFTSDDSLIVATSVGRSDISVPLDDGETVLKPDQPLTYALTVTNEGPDPARGALVTTRLAASTLEGATWTCAAADGATCTPSGAGDVRDRVSLPVGASVTYSIATRVGPGASCTISVAEASAPFLGADAQPGNNAATDADGILSGVQVRFIPTSGQEGQAARFKVILAAASCAPFTLPIATQDGTALAGADYLFAGDQVAVPAGVAKFFIDVTTLRDTLREPVEDFVLRVLGPIAAQATGLISDVH